MKFVLIAAGSVALAAAALVSLPASAQTAQSAPQRCCQSDRGPEAVPFSGRWVGSMSRDRCVSMTYGFWDGDPLPNDARRVCAIRGGNPPDDPIPLPPEEHREPPRSGGVIDRGAGGGGGEGGRQP